jgi:hypothetical protein
MCKPEKMMGLRSFLATTHPTKRYVNENNSFDFREVIIQIGPKVYREHFPVNFKPSNNNN